jgi:hypothetical protein
MCDRDTAVPPPGSFALVSIENFGLSHALVLPDLFPVALWFSGASLPLGSPPGRSPTAPPTPPPPPAANFACATGMGPGLVMVVTVAAGIISVDMANIGTPAGGDLAPRVTGRYGNRLAGIQLHSSTRGELFCLLLRRRPSLIQRHFAHRYVLLLKVRKFPSAI